MTQPATPTDARPDARTFTSFAEFYPYYLSQHANLLCRRAHFIGRSSAIAGIAQYIDSMNPWWLH